MMHWLLILTFFATVCIVFTSHLPEGSEWVRPPCKVGYDVSPTFISETSSEQENCKDNEYCREVTVTAAFRDNLPKKYLAFGECVAKSEIQGGCDAIKYCKVVMVDVLTKHMNTTARARAHRCSLRCCEANGSCTGTNTSPVREYFLIEPGQGEADVKGNDQGPTILSGGDSVSTSSVGGEGVISGSLVGGAGDVSVNRGSTLSPVSGGSSGGSSSPVSGGSSGGLTSPVSGGSSGGSTSPVSGGSSSPVSGGSSGGLTSPVSGGSSGGSTSPVSGGISGGISGGSSSSVSEGSPGYEESEADHAIKKHDHCIIGNSLTSSYESDLTNWTTCRVDESCRKISINLQYLDYSTSQKILHVGDCIENNQSNGQCDASDSICDDVINQYVIPFIPENSKATHSSCTIDCCSTEACVGSGIGRGGPFFQELQNKEPVSYDSDAIPLLPGCTFQEANDDIWLCHTMYYNDYPYADDEDRCRTNAEYMKMCLKRVATSCLYGDKPTMWDALGVYRPSSANWQLHEDIASASMIDLLSAACDPETRALYSKTNKLPHFGQMTDMLAFDDFWKDAKKLVDGTLLAKDYFTFCRMFGEFSSLTEKFISNMAANTYNVEYLDQGSSALENYTTLTFNYMSKSFLKRKLPRCMAVAQMEEEVSMYEYNPGFFLESDENGCDAYNLDVLIAVDGSKTVARDDFSKLLQFIRNITDRFDVKNNYFSLMQFSGRITKASADKRHFRREFELGGLRSHLEIIEALKNVKQLRRKRVFLERVFDHAEEELQNSPRFSDPCVKQVILLITAEKFLDSAVSLARAQQLRNSGITLIGVKIGGTSNEVIYHSLVNGDPASSERFHQSTNFNHMEGARVGVIEDLFNLFLDGTGMFRTGA